MPEIFINYRTGDGDQVAATLDEALGHRFGPDAVFRDGRSIRAGAEYPRELLTALRRSSALLVVIGSSWVADPRLRRPDDWVRREILEARECRIPIFPVLGDPSLRWLTKDQLPNEISWLAEIQALRYAPYTSAMDVVRIGDELSNAIPDLKETRRSTASDPANGTHNSVTSDGQGTYTQGRDFSGDIAGTMYKGNNYGAFNTGTGDQHLHHNTNSPQFNGDGGTFVAGDNNGGIHQNFGGGRRRRPDEDGPR